MLERLALSMNRMRKLGSIADQALVSGGNFLTIAICAHALPLSEQGKFTYVFASYMALLLLNVAGIFQGAAVRAPAQDSSYRISLARLQLLQAVLLSVLVCVVWFAAGEVFGWQPALAETVLLFAFLVMQQMADFDRRTAYIFAGTKRAIVSSALLYPGRLIGLAIIRPETVSQVLQVLVVSALVPAAVTLYIACRRKSADAPSWTRATGEHLAYSKLFIAGAPLGWLWSYIPIFMLGTMHGKEQASSAGQYSRHIQYRERIDGATGNQGRCRLGALASRGWAARHGGGSNADAQFGLVFWLSGMLLVTLLGREICMHHTGTCC